MEQKEVKKTIISKIGGAVVGMCSGIVIDKFLKSFFVFRSPMKLSQKMIYGIGIYGISGLIGSLVTKDSEKDVKDILEIVDTVKEIRDIATKPKEVPNIEVDDSKEE